MDCVVSTPENSPNVKEPEKSTMGHDLDTDFYVWMESLEFAEKQLSKRQKDVITMIDIFSHLVSSSTVKSRVYIGQDIH